MTPVDVAARPDYIVKTFHGQPGDTRMAIIIEGHDNSGKSTLAQKLASYIGLRIQESEGPPKSAEEINARVDGYELLRDTLFVRHPVISNSIYGQFRPEGD